MKIYKTEIYYNSDGRRRIFGCFESWVDFARFLGVSVSKIRENGDTVTYDRILDESTRLYIFTHPEQAWERVEDFNKGIKVIGLIPISSPDEDNLRVRQERGHEKALEYVRINKGILLEEIKND